MYKTKKAETKAESLDTLETVENIYQKKTFREHVLAKPDTYIGSMDVHTELMWVYEHQIIHLKEVTFASGFVKIFDEIIRNAVENKERDPKMDRIQIDISESDITVVNNGKGIPVVIHKDHNMFLPTLLFGHMLTSSNNTKNGLGAKLCNIFSKKFTVETGDSASKKIFRQTWQENMSIAGKPELINDDSTEDYTKIIFQPDLNKFGLHEIDQDHIAVLSKMAYDIAATNRNCGLHVYLNGSELSATGDTFDDYGGKYKGNESTAAAARPRFVAGDIGNPVGRLQEFVQQRTRGMCPLYNMYSEGTSQNPVFKVTLSLPEKICTEQVTALASSKQNAKTKAANKMLKLLNIGDKEEVSKVHKKKVHKDEFYDSDEHKYQCDLWQGDEDSSDESEDDFTPASAVTTAAVATAAPAAVAVAVAAAATAAAAAPAAAPTAAAADPAAVAAAATAAAPAAGAAAPPSAETYIIFVRGLPFSATASDVIDVFSEKCCINDSAINFTLNNDARPTGECFIELNTQKDFQEALKLDNTKMGKRYIEVYQSSKIKAKYAKGLSGANIVHMRGLPFGVKAQGIMQWFSAIAKPKSVTFNYNRAGLPNGEADCVFETANECRLAMKKNRDKMQMRYIELFYEG